MAVSRFSFRRAQRGWVEHTLAPVAYNPRKKRVNFACKISFEVIPRLPPTRTATRRRVSRDTQPV